jgi:hypothetical protein
MKTTAKLNDKQIDRHGPRTIANVCHHLAPLFSHYRLPLICLKILSNTVKMFLNMYQVRYVWQERRNFRK